MCRVNAHGPLRPLGAPMPRWCAASPMQAASPSSRLPQPWLGHIEFVAVLNVGSRVERLSQTPSPWTTQWELDAPVRLRLREEGQCGAGNYLERYGHLLPEQLEAIGASLDAIHRSVPSA